LKKIDVNRRAFLRGDYLTRQGRAEQAKRQKPLGRPPPWHQDQPLQSHCIGCSQPCVTACEVGIIQIHPQDHRLKGLPYLDFTSSGCTFCRACVEVCPIEIVIKDPTPRIGKLALNRGSCIAWNDIICMSCSNRCDYKAITTQHQRRPNVDAQTCTGCGMCVAACPVQALNIV
jgi:ferredoxin-type protein NapF